MTFLPGTGPPRAILVLDLFPDLAIREAAISRLAEMRKHNPLLRVRLDERSGAIRIADRSESKLREIRGQLEHDVGRAIEFGPLGVVCVEAIRKPAEGEGKYIRQTGGCGNYGHLKIRIEPSDPGVTFQFLNEIRGGVVPREYVDPIRQGIQEAAEAGILTGCEVVCFTATLYDGSFHEIDSNEMAFRIAGSMAFRDAAGKTERALMEPIMAVEITSPVEEANGIIRDLTSRRGRIKSIEWTGRSRLLRAEGPLRALLGYADRLRSQTQDRANCTMKFLRYEEVSGADGDDLTGLPVARPQSPAPHSGSAAADPEPDWT